MNDAENLTKLLRHLQPARCHAFLLGTFGFSLPDLDAGQTKTAQRAAMAAALTTLSPSDRQRLEEVAEKVVLLTDGPGQDVVQGIRTEIADDAERTAFDALPDQYERSLWLYTHAPSLFKEALDARQADVFRQSLTCYSGFVALKHLTLATDPTARDAFHDAIARQLGCARNQVAVQIFKRLRPDAQSGEDIDLYQISINHNRPPEIVDRVQRSELVGQEVVRAVSSHITYEPANGHLEVLSRETDGRPAWARITADCLLQSPFDGEKIPLKQYQYQSLAAPRSFDLAGEPVASVKVVELGYVGANHRSLQVKTWANDPDDIYTAARSLIGPAFDFRHHRLTYARLSIRLKKVGSERARTLSVILRDENKCNIKTKREKDRALCDRLLATWKLVREIGDVVQLPGNKLAA